LTSLTQAITVFFGGRGQKNVSKDRTNRALPPLSLADEAYHTLVEVLSSGSLLPGEQLTLERASEFVEMSSTPIREAFQRLASEGALHIARNRRAYVPIISRERMLELRSVRLALEPLIADAVVKNATEEDCQLLEEIAANIRKARAEKRITDDITLIRNFHFEIYNISKLPVVAGILRSLWTSTGPYLHLLFPAFIEQQKQEVRAVFLKALWNKDAKAAKEALVDDIGPALAWLADLVEDGTIANDKRFRQPS